MSTSSTASKKPTSDTYAALIARLQTLRNSTRAEKEKAYQKSRWEHWGVALPKMDLAIREIPKDLSPQKLLSLSARLWREPVWDLKIVATRIVARDAMPATEQLWKFVRARVPDLDGWAVADNLASVGSRCLLADPWRLDDVESWVASRHLWTRRAALVFTLPWTRNDRDPERMLRWASKLRGRSRMVYPKSNRLVVARTIQTYPVARAKISASAQPAEECCPPRSLEIFA